MRHNMVFLSIVESERFQTTSFNIPLLFALVIILVLALVVCYKLAKRFHLYESNNKKEILEHS